MISVLCYLNDHRIMGAGGGLDALKRNCPCFSVRSPGHAGKRKGDIPHSLRTAKENQFLNDDLQA